MAYRLANVGGFELILNLEDKARAGRLCQYVLKPAAHAIAGLKAAAGGAFASLAARPPRCDPAPSTQAATAALSPEAQSLQERIRATQWYHTIDLGNGVRTPGRFNHYPLLRDYSLPDSLAGLSALDVATMNGFWAFEMERRGASVTALDVGTLGDLDIPPAERARLTPEQLAEPRGTGFLLAREALRSNVRYEKLNVYELSPERSGRFDFVFAGDLLLHLMNPVRAAANICSVTSGVAHIVDCFNPYLPHMTMLYHGAEQGTWWGMSLSALERVLRDAGFRNVELIHRFKAPSQPGQKAWMWRAVFRCSM